MICRKTKFQGGKDCCQNIEHDVHLHEKFCVHFEQSQKILEPILKLYSVKYQLINSP